MFRDLFLGSSFGFASRYQARIDGHAGGSAFAAQDRSHAIFDQALMVFVPALDVTSRSASRDRRLAKRFARMSARVCSRCGGGRDCRSRGCCGLVRHHGTCAESGCQCHRNDPHVLRHNIDLLIIDHSGTLPAYKARPVPGDFINDLRCSRPARPPDWSVFRLRCCRNPRHRQFFPISSTPLSARFVLIW
jgi:hypothetical protein